MKNKKLKTNMLMEVNIGQYGILKVYHKDEMVQLDSVLKLVNNSRAMKEKKVKDLTLRDILSKVDLWKFIIELSVVDIERNLNEGVTPSFKTIANYDMINEFKDSKGRIKYKELIKKFQNLIYSKRGRVNGGTWADLRVALKIASIVDKAIEANIYTVFVKENILQIRDNGGESFKKLNKLICRLPDFDMYNDRHYYKEVARLIRHQVFNLPNYDHYDNIWNEEIATQDKLDKRDELINKFSMLLEDGYIETYHKLWLKLGGSDPKVEKFILAGS